MAENLFIDLQTMDDPNDPHRYDLALSVFGTRKCGKSTFVVGNKAAGIPSCPQPIYIINLDNSIRELIDKVDEASKAGIYVTTLVPNKPAPLMSDRDWKGLVDKAEQSILYAAQITMAEGGTLVIDTATQMWEYIRMAELAPIQRKREAEGKRLYQYDYGIANTRMRNLLYMMKPAGNLVLLHHAQEQFDSNGNSLHTYTYKGFGEVDQIVQTEVQLWVKEYPGTNRVPEHGGTIIYCRQQDNLRGVVLPNISFDLLRDTIY